MLDALEERTARPLLQLLLSLEDAGLMVGQRLDRLALAWKLLLGSSESWLVNQEGGLPVCEGLVGLQYLLAMEMLVRDPHQRQWPADSLLAHLHLRWRLSEGVWATCDPEHSAHQPTTTCASPAPTHTLSTPLALDDTTALQAATLTGLQQAFQPRSVFWSDHAYHEPSTPFFSYVFDLSKQPSSIVELAALQLYHHPLLAGLLSKATHVEWWAHSRALTPPSWASSGHQLHFDCDERRLRRGEGAYKLRHPLFSSVLYLSQPGGECRHTTDGEHAGSSGVCLGGPTLVLDQTPGQAVGADTQAWAVLPALGRYLLFPGNMLHGVLPGLPHPTPTHVNEQGAAQGGDADDAGASAQLQGEEAACDARTTLMLAWWCVPEQQEHPAQASNNTDADAASTQPAITHATTNNTGGDEGLSSLLGPWMSVEQRQCGSDAASTPQEVAPWIHLFQQLMQQAQSEQACLDSAPSHDMRHWVPSSITPAWSQVDVQHCTSPSAPLPPIPAQVLDSVRHAVPDLRFFITHQDTFKDMYPV